jgi:hypothetical protein
VLAYAVTAWCAPTAAALEAAWESHRAALDAHAVFPFRFDGPFWARVADGEVARRRDSLEGTDRVLGVIYVPTPRDTAWVAIQDPHAGTVDGFVDENLPSSTFARRVAYQRIALPWPLQPRQWVIEVVNNGALRDRTGGALWERTWTLSDQRGAAAELPSAVWLPVNDGGWFLLDVHAEGTLVGYHARTSIGGVVPDEAALRWSYGTLERLLRDIRARATDWVDGHYVAAHPLVLRPDETPVPVRPSPP